MDMNAAEIAKYKFRVGRAHFEEYPDAYGYMKSSLHEDSIDLRMPDGTWLVGWCTDRTDERPSKRGGESSKPYRKIPRKGE